MGGSEGKAQGQGQGQKEGRVRSAWVKGEIQVIPVRGRPTYLFWMVWGLICLLPKEGYLYPTAQGCLGRVGSREGECAPDFELRNLEGQTFRLSAFQGKTVVLHFWATWCSPCRAELLEIERIRKKLPSHRVIIWAVSVDQDGQQVLPGYLRETFGEHRPSFPILWDPHKEVSLRYGTVKVPETYIIDKAGRIRDKKEGVLEWNDSLILHYLECLSGS